MTNDKKRKNAASLVSSALLGLDYKVVLIQGKRYVIQPPTIAKIAGASRHLAPLAEAETIADMLTTADLTHAAAALSWFIEGNGGLTEKLKEGTMREITTALAEAYTLIDLADFSMLSTLAKNVTKLAAKQKQ